MKIILHTAKAPINARTEFAQSTWKGNFELRVVECERTAKDIGCTRGCYYVKDIYDKSLELNDDDIFCYINSDCALVPEWTDIIVPIIAKFGCAYSHRVEVSKFGRMFHANDFINHNTSLGVDFMAFTPAWWKAHRDKFPDGVIGHEGHDFPIVYYMRKSGFDRMPPVIWHERHLSFWNRPHNLQDHPVQKEVRRRLVEWTKTEPGSERYLSKGAYLFCSIYTPNEYFHYSDLHQRQLQRWKYVGP
jgi:hypothetical protein